MQAQYGFRSSSSSSSRGGQPGRQAGGRGKDEEEEKEGVALMYREARFEQVAMADIKYNEHVPPPSQQQGAGARCARCAA